MKIYELLDGEDEWNPISLGYFKEEIDAETARAFYILKKLETTIRKILHLKADVVIIPTELYIKFNKDWLERFIS